MQPRIDWRLISSTGYDEDKAWYETAYDGFKDGFEAVVNTVTTGVNVVLDTVGGLLGPLIDLSAVILRMFFSIPFFGGFFSMVLGGIQAAVWFLVSLVDFILALLGILPEKRMKLRVIIQLDESGTPTTTVAEGLRFVQATIDVFKDQANVRVLPVGYFKYASAFQDTPTTSSAYFMTEDKPSTSETLDVCCDACAVGHALTTTGPKFQDKMMQDCSEGNVSALIGYNSPICAFAVRTFTDGKLGCSLGPFADYVTVNFHSAAKDDVCNPRPVGFALALAHEIGHACSLSHNDGAIIPDGLGISEVGDGNLMNPKPTHRGPSLTRLQIAVLRTSRHITYFDLPF